MKWLRELRRRKQGAHTFLLYNNIADDVLRGKEFERLYNVLATETPMRDACIIAFFNLATGIRFPAEAMRTAFIRLVVQPGLAPDQNPEIVFEENKRDLGYAFAWLDTLLHLGWEDLAALLPKQPQHPHPPHPQRKTKAPKADAPFAAVVFEYAETLAPPDAASRDMNDRRALVTFLWWAQDAAIRARKNLLVLETDTLKSVSPQLISSTTGIVPLEVELPARDEHLQSIAAWRETHPRGEEDIADMHLARIVTGIPHTIVRQLLEEAHAERTPLTAATVFGRKNSLLTEQSGGMLQASMVPYGPEALGSLDHIVEHLRHIAEGLKAGDPRRVPAGTMLVGPPGTGKTAIAEVLSNLAEVPFVKLVQNVRDPYVGMSERRMELVLRTLRANAPLILFIDEFDKHFPNLDEVLQGDSGVSAALQGMLLEFLSDPAIHGLVYIIIATNRPRRINPAMIRAGRFDEIIPVLLPKAEDRPDIIRALLTKHTVIYRAQHGMTLTVNVTERDIAELAEMADFYIDKKALRPGPRPKEMNGEEYPEWKTVSLTGANLEVVIKKAVKDMAKAEDEELTGAHLKRAMQKYLPTHDMVQFRLMNEEALAYANDEDFIPPAYRDEWRELKARRGSQQTPPQEYLFPR